MKVVSKNVYQRQQKWTKRGVFQSKGETRRHNHNYDIAEGSTLDADKILYSFE